MNSAPSVGSEVDGKEQAFFSLLLPSSLPPASPSWQRLIWSQLDAQKVVCRVPGAASQSRIEKGGCGLRAVT